MMLLLQLLVLRESCCHITHWAMLTLLLVSSLTAKRRLHHPLLLLLHNAFTPLLSVAATWRHSCSQFRRSMAALMVHCTTSLDTLLTRLH
jgi:hypothetical protein